MTTPENDLLTPLSYALSLSPPRAPPFDSAQRALLLGKDPSKWAVYHPSGNGEWLHERLVESHKRNPRRKPHPHLLAKSNDGTTRWIGTLLPKSFVNSLRDHGYFRAMADGLVTISVPFMAIASPGAAIRFLQLSYEKLRYGPHRMQTIDMFLPNGTCRGLLFFVHGGAWGSGLPWMYRLVAGPFLELRMAVAIVGYRTYPDANVDGKISDLEQAMCEIQKAYPDLCRSGSDHLGVCIMGHSSGAHIGLIMVMQQAQCDSFVGISGVYDISHHFDYEASRGVEELSPLKATNGKTRQAFRHYTPHFRPNNSLPDMLFVHGMEDTTVPFTSTAEAARSIRSRGVRVCDEVYLAKTGHEQTIMEMMLGGKTKNAVLQWIQQREQPRSRL